jgi:hypothetical protein
VNFLSEGSSGHSLTRRSRPLYVRKSLSPQIKIIEGKKTIQIIQKGELLTLDIGCAASPIKRADPLAHTPSTNGRLGRREETTRQRYRSSTCPFSLRPACVLADMTGRKGNGKRVHTPWVVVVGVCYVHKSRAQHPLMAHLPPYRFTT